MEQQEKEKNKKQKFMTVAVPVLVALMVIGILVVGFFILKNTFFQGSKIKTENLPEGFSEEDPSASEITGGNTEDGGGNETKTVAVKNGITANGINDTGDFSLYATEYEGKKGTGKYNYGEALQKALLFYELQRSGDLPEKTRCNWRGDSALNDGADHGVDLTGGLYDAGDHVKFNLPMAYTAAVLSWSVYENRKAYEESGQLEYALNNIRWIDDYLIKCHTGNEEFYYQVGNGGFDHGWWGPCEIMTMERPSYKLDASNPGSTVTAESAAALAAGAVIFEKDDPAYADECLKQAKAYYDFAAKYLSDDGYKEANGYYDSHSGFYDELSFAATWLYLATGDKSYEADAKKWFDQKNCDCRWTLCWDDASYGTALIMGRETKDKAYTSYIEESLDYWTTGVGGERVTYTPKGLAWLDAWGSLRYASAASFLALTYADSDVCPKDKKKTYHDFAVDQIGYCLGDTGFSYEIGFGENYPKNPHHRTAQGSPSNNMNDPAEARHVLCGALVGGPDASDNYADEVSNYVNNEVADDYNAGFVGALAALYEEYGGQTIKNYGAVENIPDDEIMVEGSVNVNGDHFIEVKAYVINHSAWPARALNDAVLCYFVDLSELYENGGSVNDITVNMNYSQGGSAAGLQAWDEEKHIYYLPVSFAGTVIAPGTQDTSKKEVQFRMTSDAGWDNSNDYSYQDIAGTNGSSMVPCTHMALYDGDTLVYGSVPDGKEVKIVTGDSGNNQGKDNDQNAGNDNNNQQDNGQDEGRKETGKAGASEATGDNLKLTIQNQSTKGSDSTMAFTVNLENTGKADLDLSDVEIEYFFSDPDINKLIFYCDYACIQGERYEALTDSIKGRFSNNSCKDKTAKNSVVISCNDNKKKLPGGHSWVIQVRVARGDWSALNFDDDYSAYGPEHILVKNGSRVLIGEEPN